MFAVFTLNVGDMSQQLPDFSSELRISTSRSSGAGGQHVNKVETKVEIRWNVATSIWFTDEEKIKIQQYARGLMTSELELILVCQETRSQLQNKRLGIQRLRQLVIITTILGFLFSASSATAALFMVKELGLDPRFFGVVLAIQGVGGVAGGLLANRLSTRFTRGKTLAATMILATALIALTGLVPNIYLFTVVATVAGMASTIWNILLMSTYQVLIPNHLYGRIHGARRTIVWGLMPIGAFLGGVIATGGLRLPFIICGIIGFIVAIRALPFVIAVANSTISEEESETA